MGFKIKKVFLLFCLILLQSCSGGRIGNFLESSFKNIEEPKIKEEDKKKLKDNLLINSELNKEKNKRIKEPKIKEEDKKKLKDNLLTNSELNKEKNKRIKETKIEEEDKNNSKEKIIVKNEEKSKNNKKVTGKNLSLQKRKYQPQSYKIIFILKDVDPKDPIENISTILRNSDVNFEIEKIERFFDSKNKNKNKN